MVLHQSGERGGLLSLLQYEEDIDFLVNALFGRVVVRS